MSLTGAIRENTNGDINVGPTTTLTVFAWTKRNSGSGTLVNRWGGGSGSRQFLLEINPAVCQVAICDGAGNDVVAGATTVSTGAWHALALRKNGTGAGALQAWLDGVADGSGTSNRTVQSLGNVSQSQFRVGIRSTAGSAYDGLIAHAAMWTVALTDAEMVALAKGVSPLGIRPDALLHYWPLYNITAIGADFDNVPYTLISTGLGGTGDPAEGPVGCPFPVAV